MRLDDDVLRRRYEEASPRLEQHVADEQPDEQDQDKDGDRRRDLPAGEAARKRAVGRVVREVAGYLGNTPAVARASYIDPRVISRYENGHTIANVMGDLGKDSDFGDLATRGRAERAVLRLLADQT